MRKCLFHCDSYYSGEMIEMPILRMILDCELLNLSRLTELFGCSKSWSKCPPVVGCIATSHARTPKHYCHSYNNVFNKHIYYSYQLDAIWNKLSWGLLSLRCIATESWSCDQKSKTWYTQCGAVKTRSFFSPKSSTILTPPYLGARYGVSAVILCHCYRSFVCNIVINNTALWRHLTVSEIINVPMYLKILPGIYNLFQLSVAWLPIYAHVKRVNGVYKISFIFSNLKSNVNVIVRENKSYTFVLVRLKECYIFFYLAVHME